MCICIGPRSTPAFAHLLARDNLERDRKVMMFYLSAASGNRMQPPVGLWTCASEKRGGGFIHGMSLLIVIASVWLRECVSRCVGDGRNRCSAGSALNKHGHFIRRSCVPDVFCKHTHGERYMSFACVYCQNFGIEEAGFVRLFVQCVNRSHRNGF